MKYSFLFTILFIFTVCFNVTANAQPQKRTVKYIPPVGATAAALKFDKAGTLSDTASALNNEDLEITLTSVPTAGAGAVTIVNLEFPNATRQTVHKVPSAVAPGTYKFLISKAELGPLVTDGLNLNFKKSDSNFLVATPIKLEVKNPPPPPPAGAGTLKNRQQIIDSLKGRGRFRNPYDYKNNKVYLYFDANGKLLNHLPVNIDQNDQFIITIVCQKGDENLYSLNISEGDYAANDLVIRPHDGINAATGIVAQSSEGTSVLAYTVTTIIHEPVTTERFQFQIAYDDSVRNHVITHSDPHSIRINKLYHVGVGVSIVSSGLENPGFKTFYNGTDTTIQAFNTGRRTIFTFNVIWYWSILQQKKEGSVVTNGRDILKDEPTFSWTRIFPTAGVSFDKDFKENIFLGAVYEFARGGSIIAGMHYGKVNVLADKNFKLGETRFSGTDNTIKLDSKYKAGFFIGINVDTRIINVLFSRN